MEKSNRNDFNFEKLFVYQKALDFIDFVYDTNVAGNNQDVKWIKKFITTKIKSKVVVLDYKLRTINYKL